MSERVTLGEAKRIALELLAARDLEIEEERRLEAALERLNWPEGTYNPATHRLVPRDAVVLERSKAETAHALAELGASRFVGTDTLPASRRPVDIFERGARKQFRSIAKYLRSALASAQGNEEGNDG